MEGFIDKSIGRIIRVLDEMGYCYTEVFHLLLKFYFGKITMTGSTLGFSLAIICLLSVMKSSEYG